MECNRLGDPPWSYKKLFSGVKKLFLSLSKSFLTWGVSEQLQIGDKIIFVSSTKIVLFTCITPIGFSCEHLFTKISQDMDVAQKDSGVDKNLL